MKNSTSMGLGALLLLLVSYSPAYAQATAFAYQGKLADGGTPTTGNYDFEFKLFDTTAVGTGAQLGSTVQRLNVSVAIGVFTVSLDFGVCATCFNGTDRFLEISVKPAGGGTFTILGPRQPITSTPYALKSVNATAADGLSVTCVNCVTSGQIQNVQGSQVTGSIAGSQINGAIPVASVPSGSTNYIQNTTSQQPMSNFNISGTGTADIFNASTRYNLGGSPILSAGGTNNLFAGVGAGAANTGTSNAFFGRSAGQANITGDQNAFFGYQAGLNNNIGDGNAFFGNQAGSNNSGGSSNAFFGLFAGGLNTTGSSNSFFGNSAGFANTTGIQNTIIGSSANVGANNLSFATALGAGAVVSTSNTIALGRSSGADVVSVPGNLTVNGNGTAAGTLSASVVNATGASGQYHINGNRVLSAAGTSNLFVGVNAGTSNTGSGNSFGGSSAGMSNTSGGSNSFFGESAGMSNTGGNINSFFGRSAGKLNTSGGGNAFFGSDAGIENTMGDSNAFFGVQAGENNTTGDNNSFFGRDAGTANTIGSGNSCFGWGSGSVGGGIGVIGVNITLLGAKTETTGALSNATAVGYQAEVSQSNSLVLGSIDGVNGATATVSVGIGTTAPVDRLQVAGDIRVGTGTNGCVKDANGTIIAGACSSDVRLKRDITAFPNLLDKLTQLQPVHFYWRTDQFPDKHFGSSQSFGLVAQDVEKVMPELVSEDGSGYKVVRYSKLPLLTIQAIKELKAENDSLQEQVHRQQQDLDLLKLIVCREHPKAELCHARRSK